VRVPLTVRTTHGAGRCAAAQHSQTLYAWFAHAPGLKVVVPSSPADAKGLLKSAIRDDNPVILFEDRLLYRQKGLVPGGDHVIPLGQAEVKRAGRDVTIIALSTMVGVALKAAAALTQEGIEVEVVDPRTLVPLDVDLLVSSVARTHRALVVDQGCLSFGVSAEIAALLSAHAFDALDAPVARLAGPDVPIPYSYPLDQAILPNEQQICAEVKKLLA